MLLPRFTNHRLEDERKIARIILETGETPAGKQRGGAKRTGHRSAEGDTRRLRGLPVVARGVAGVSPGTDPWAEVLRRWA